MVHELRSASSRVTIAGWALSPLMPLLRGDEERSAIFAQLMREVSEQTEVYILLWAGAEALFQPNRRSVEAVRARLLEVAPRVRCQLDGTASFSHDHHQKAVTVDGRVAYVGGMDISTFHGDRWDTAAHPLRAGVGWHDAQLRVEGEVVADVEQNFCQRWEGATGERLYPSEHKADDGQDTPAQLVRTIPKGFYPRVAPHGHYGIRHALLKAVAVANEYVYLENQYLWAPEIVEALCDAMDRRIGSDFRIIVVLPARAYDGRYDNDDHVRKLCAHDAGKGSFAAYSLFATGPAESLSGYAYLPIYVHAKVAIIDDAWLMVGSANLNRRGLATDSEIAVHTTDAAAAHELRIKLWAEHLGMQREEIEARSVRELADDEWKRRGLEMERRARDSDLPPQWHVHSYAYQSSLPSRLMDRLQAATLEH